MEIKYDITINTAKGWLIAVCCQPENKMLITNASPELFKIATGKELDLFLQQLYIWGNKITLVKSIAGLTDVYNLCNILEESLSKYIVNDNRKWIQIWTGCNFTYFPYTTEEERLKILDDCKDLFVTNKLKSTPIESITKNVRNRVEKSKNNFVLDLGL